MTRSTAILMHYFVRQKVWRATSNAHYFSPGTCIATSWTIFFDIATPMAATPFQADRRNAAKTQKILHARQAIENREEGCVYGIPLSDLIGTLLELKYIRSTRAHPYL